MIDFVQFLWLIHYGLILLYSWEIGVFCYRRVRYPEAYKLGTKVPGAFEKISTSIGSTAVTVIGLHCFAYGIASNAVPIVLLIYGGVSIFCTFQNEVAKPFLAGEQQKAAATPSKGSFRDRLPAVAIGIGAAIVIAVIQVAATGRIVPQLPGIGGVVVMSIAQWVIDRQRKAKPAGGPSPGGRGASSSSRTSDEDSDFSFKEDRWHSSQERPSPSGSGESYNAEADYQNALNEAQKWANQASSKENAKRWADKFEKLAGNPSLHAKDKLRYRLAAMLLRERLKGQGAQKAGEGGSAPTDADLSRLGLPVPPQ